MKLTDRLLKIASLVDNGKRIADIGTDHGYIPVYLLNQNKIQYAILGDVNKGPLENARKEGIIEAILVGDIDKTKEIAEKLNIDLNNYELMDIKDLSEASLKAVELVSSKKADIVMKGLVDTSIVLKAVLNKEIGLRTGNVLSHTGVFAVEGYNRLFFITDAAMNIDPDLNTKKQIIQRSESVCRERG